jgi:hypothetical protein
MKGAGHAGRTEEAVGNGEDHDLGLGRCFHAGKGIGFQVEGAVEADCLALRFGMGGHST